MTTDHSKNFTKFDFGQIPQSYIKLSVEVKNEKVKFVKEE